MNGDMRTGALGRAAGHAGAQIAVIAMVLVLALAGMEPAGAAGLGFGAGLAFHALHIGPASLLAWWCSGWLLRTPLGRRGSPWPWLVLAGAVAGAALAPWSLWLEQLFGVIDDDPPAIGLLAALGDEWSKVVPLTALLWPAMNLLVVWRQDPPGAHTPAPGPALPAQALPAGDPGTVGATALPPPGPAPRAGDAAATQAVPTAPTEQAAPTAPTAKAAPTALTATPVPVASFLDRVPAALGRDVVWLHAQEHYLSVTTTRGRHLLLQAFGPAVAELGRLGLDGMQVHRSAWVAWSHVERLDERARSPAVVLRDGTRVAVGRRRLAEVCAAWAARERDRA